MSYREELERLREPLGLIPEATLAQIVQHALDRIEDYDRVHKEKVRFFLENDELKERVRLFEIEHKDLDTLANVRKVLIETQAERDVAKDEIERLRRIGDEFIWGEDNPDEYESEMTKLKAENERLRRGGTRPWWDKTVVAP